MNIVLLESLGVPDAVLNACAKPLTDAGHSFKAYAKNTDPQVQIEEAKDADVIMIANMPLKGEVIRACQNLKYIDVAFTGVDHVDLEAAKACGVKVSNAAGYSTQAVADLAHQIEIDFKPGDPEQRVFVDGTEVTTAIRQNEINANVSAVAAIPAVREEMTAQQRQIAARGGIVMDGRDIGTTVLPTAQVKVFLVASAAERARRRFEENKRKGIATTTLEELQAAIERRDKLDSEREVSPLTQAPDATRLDSTHLTIDQVVDEISGLIKKSASN